MAYQCPICDFVSQNKKVLGAHISESHVKCGECGKVMRDATSLKKHMLDTHGIGEKKKVEKVPFEERLNHKVVWMKLINGEVLSGKIHVNRSDPYNIRLEVGDNSMVIPKHSFVYYSEVPL